MKQKTRILIYILIAAAVVVLGVLGVLSMRGGGSGDISEHIDLGRKYLIELSYDKAVIEFTEAINIDPNNVDAYLGLAEAYEKIGDIPKAIEWLEKGFSITGDPQIKEMLDRLRTLVDSDSSAVTESETAPPEETTVTETVTEMSSEVRVPYLLGMTEERAIKTCESVGLKCEVSYAGSDKAEKGCVFGQAIAAGTMVDRGASVPVEVSEGSVINVELAAENLEFDYLAEFEESGWAFAVKGNVGGYVNTEGRFVEVYDNVPAKEDEWSTYWAWSDGIGFKEGSGDWFNFDSPFMVSIEGIYPYYNGSKWGYANINTGEVISECKYDTVTAFNCGRGLAGIKEAYEYTYSIIDEKGKEVKTGIKGSDLTNGFINNIAIIDLNFKSNMYDINGNIIQSNIVSQVYGGTFLYKKDCAIVFQVESKYLVITPDLKVCALTDLPYAIDVCCISSEYIMFRDNYENKFFIVNYNENCKVVGQYNTDLSWFNTMIGTNCIARGESESSGWSLYDFNGNKLIADDFEFMGNPRFDLISVKKNNKFGFIDRNGNLAIDFKIDSDNIIWLFTNDENTKLISVLCAIDGNLVLIDNTGNIYYEFIGNFVDTTKSNIITEKDGKYFIYSLDD